MTSLRSDGPAAGGATVADVVVVGAGPAGLSAAVAAADAGAGVILIDAEPVVGGQFWRHPAPTPRVDCPRARRGASWGSRLDAAAAVTDREVAGLHHDLRRYRRLRRRLAGHAAAGTVTHLARHEVWAVSRIAAACDSTGPHPGPVPAGPAGGGVPGVRFRVQAVTGSGGARREVTVAARTLVLATGAYDLQLPFPGWDLPGVMTAGGVQSLLKGHAVLAGRRVVVAGTGPFLLSVASGLARSGADVLGVFEAARPGAWVRRPSGLLAAGSKLGEGLGYARDLARHRIGYHTGWTVTAAGGRDRLDSVTVAPLRRDGRADAARSRTLAADVLAVGWGFAVHLDLPLALGCGTDAGAGGLPVVVVDADQRTTVAGVYAAGEVCGVGGAALAVVEGEIAGAAAAADVAVAPASGAGPARAGGAEGRGGRAARDGRRARLRRFAAALADAYPVPPHWADRVADDTVVCRCEEVTAGAIRRVAREDAAADARTVKLLARPGMGWCQGRICGYATDCLAADACGAAPRHRPVERPMATPVPLGVVAAQPDPGADGA